MDKEEREDRMKACEGRIGRVFVLRLEDGDEVPECIEEFAAQNGVATGHVVLIVWAAGGQVVVGPRRTDARPIDPMLLTLDGADEVAGVGVLAPDEQGRPVLHIHAALGRSGQTMTGCLRKGVETWVVGEAILYEIAGARAARLPEAETGLSLLTPGAETTHEG
jgi:predicted DNA-binding protein with PD1-like motif